MQPNCKCSFRWTDAVGTHDAVTGEWLPDMPTVYVDIIKHPDCEMHRNIVTCYATDYEHMRYDPDHPTQIKPGWSVRADRAHFACPKHQKGMPPYATAK